MGIFINKYKDEDWDVKAIDNSKKIDPDLLSKIEKSKKEIENSRPHRCSLEMSLENKTLDELEYIQSILSGILSKTEMVILENWIEWKSKQEE